MNMLMQINSFIKKFTIYKPSEIDKKIISLEDLRFPILSSIHYLGNLDLTTERKKDTIHFNLYPFLNKKIISSGILYHNSTLNMNFIRTLDNVRIKFYTQGLATSVRSSDQSLRSIVIPIYDSKKLKLYENKKDILALINHNPIISRLKVYSSNKKYLEYYTSLIYFHSIFHFIYNHFTNRHKIVLFPLNSKEIVPLSIYKRLIGKNQIPDSLLIKFRSSLFHFLSHLIMYYTNKDEHPIKYNFLRDQDNINVCFFNPTTKKSIIINLGIFTSLLNSSSSIMKKFLTNIYSLSLNISSTQAKELLEQEDIKQDQFMENIPTISSSDDIDSFNKITNKEDLIKIVHKKNTIINQKDISVKYHERLKNEVDEFLSKTTHLTLAQKQRYKKLFEQSLKSSINIDGKEFKIEDLISSNPDISIDDHVNDLTNKIDQDVMDPSYAKDTITNLHQCYMDKAFHHHLAKIIVHFSKTGLFFKKYEEEVEKNDHNLVKYINLTFTNVDGKTKTLKIKIPLLDSEGHFRYNGVKSYMGIQLVNLPITKIDNYRVSLSSNYGKTIIERNKSIRYNFALHLIKLIDKYNKEHPKSSIQYSKQVYSYKDANLPYEYTNIGKNIKYIDSHDYYMTFNYQQRYKELLPSYITNDQIKSLESKYGILLGKSKKDKNVLLFLNIDNIITEYHTKKQTIENEGFIIDYILPEGYREVKPEWINQLILDKRLPLIFILGYKFGLKTILKDIGIPYRLVPKGNRMNLLPYEIPIRFNDMTLIIPRYPITKSWIIAGLLHFNTLKNYSFSDMDIEDTYYELISDIGLSQNYLKGIDNFFNFFLDPITIEILEHMKEPTTPKELLYRAVEILKTEYYPEPASVKNFRLKSIEKINGIIYNEIARQYAQYLNDKSKNTPFTINTEAVLMTILQDRSVRLVEETNPIQYLKEKSLLTHGGFLGREVEAFVHKDRKYPEDGLGVISEAVPDSNKTGFNTYAPLNAMIKNIYGMVKEDININELGSGNILSAPGNVMPFSTNDDAKRLTFISIQLAHHVPSKNASPCRVKTGFESIVGHLTGNLYCVSAKDDGVVVDIQDDHFKVQYKNLGTYIYKYGNVEGEVSSFMINHSIALNDLKIGKKFKKHDILAYNDGFFKYDPIFNQINWCHGIPAYIALADVKSTLEDGSAFTKDFLEKSNFHTVHKRVIKITNDLAIKDIIKEGEHVEYDTPLVTLEYQDVAGIDISYIDNESEDNDLLSDLNKVVTKARRKGYIHKIKIYHTLDISEYHPTVQKVLKDYYKKIKKIMNENQDVKNIEDVNINPKVEPGTRIKKTEINDGELAIVFYISEEVGASIGDKFVIDNSLKTVVGEVIDYDLITKSGKKIDGVFGRGSVFDRIITSPIKLGVLELILEKIENDVIDMYFD